MERCGCWLSFCRVCKSLMELNRGSLQDESISLALVWRPGLAHSKWKVPKAGKGQSPCESDGSFCSSLVSLYLSICLFVYLFICLLIHPSVCLSVCLFVCLFVCCRSRFSFFFQIRAFHLDRWELGGKALRSGTPRTMTMYDMEAGHFPSAKPVGCDMRFFFWGSYTRDEMRDIVSYAKSLYIEIIPEIDSPGHIQAEMLRFSSAFCFIFFLSSSWIWPSFCKFPLPFPICLPAFCLLFFPDIPSWGRLGCLPWAGEPRERPHHGSNAVRCRGSVGTSRWCHGVAFELSEFRPAAVEAPWKTSCRPRSAVCVSSPRQLLGFGQNFWLDLTRFFQTNSHFGATCNQLECFECFWNWNWTSFALISDHSGGHWRNCAACGLWLLSCLLADAECLDAPDHTILGEGNLWYFHMFPEFPSLPRIYP